MYATAVNGIDRLADVWNRLLLDFVYFLLLRTDMFNEKGQL